MLELMQRAPKIEQFHRQFDTELSCIQHLFQSKWPDGFVCPRCAHRDACSIETRRLPSFQCRRCRHQTSLLAGTVMEGSSTPLIKWYTAMFLLARTGVGTTAVNLHKIIGVTYKTAWLMLRKIRQAISEADAYVRLSGAVRVNRDIYGRPSYYQQNRRHPKELFLFTGGSMDEEESIQYVKMKLASPERPQSICKQSEADDVFASSHIEDDAENPLFFPRHLVPRRHSSLARCYRLAQSWIRHTFKGIGKKYVQNYLDEFCYCFNQEQAGASPFQLLPRICATRAKTPQAALHA